MLYIVKYQVPRGEVKAAVPQWAQMRDPEAFIKVEQSAHEMGRQLSDAIVAVVLRQVICDPQFAADCTPIESSINAKAEIHYGDLPLLRQQP